MQNLKEYKKSYESNKKKIVIALWYIINFIVFNSYFFPSTRLKIFLLKTFGATIGKGFVIKPSVNIKFPWNLIIGNNVWIGENVWIDNLGMIVIKSNVCISQGAYLLTGNHNYKLKTFDLIVQDIELNEGVWIGAKSIVCPGVKMMSNSILSAGSVLSNNTNEYEIYKGNPAQFYKKRV